MGNLGIVPIRGRYMTVDMFLWWGLVTTSLKDLPRLLLCKAMLPQLSLTFISICFGGICLRFQASHRMVPVKNIFDLTLQLLK